MPFFRRRVILTGTPAPNGLIQLWPQMYILDKGKRLYPSISKYRAKWFTPNYNGFGYELRDGAKEEIYDAIDDIVMHKSHNELDLPPLVYNTIELHLPKHVMVKYKEMKNHFMIELDESDEDITAVNAASKAAKLKQIANGCVYGEEKSVHDIHNVKLEAVEELVESLAGSPLLVVYEYLHDLERLQSMFKAPNIGGGISGQELDAIVRAWNAGEIPILLIQPQSAGHGLNLQDGGCCDVCWYSITFDLELYEQVNKRVHRQGVKNSVTIHHLVAKGTVDEHVMDALSGKSELQNELLNSLLK